MTVGIRLSHMNTNPELMEPGKPGEHVWIATTAHRVYEADLHDRVRTPVGSEIQLRPENLTMLAVGCWVCEEPLSEPLLNSPCPGEPTS